MPVTRHFDWIWSSADWFPHGSTLPSSASWFLAIFSLDYVLLFRIAFGLWHSSGCFGTVCSPRVSWRGPPCALATTKNCHLRLFAFFSCYYVSFLPHWWHLHSMFPLWKDSLWSFCPHGSLLNLILQVMLKSFVRFLLCIRQVVFLWCSRYCLFWEVRRCYSCFVRSTSSSHSTMKVCVTCLDDFPATVTPCPSEYLYQAAGLLLGGSNSDWRFVDSELNSPYNCWIIFFDSWFDFAWVEHQCRYCYHWCPVAFRTSWCCYHQMIATAIAGWSCNFPDSRTPAFAKIGTLDPTRAKQNCSFAIGGRRFWPATHCWRRSRCFLATLGSVQLISESRQMWIAAGCSVRSESCRFHFSVNSYFLNCLLVPFVASLSHLNLNLQNHLAPPPPPSSDFQVLSSG